MGFTVDEHWSRVGASEAWRMRAREWFCVLVEGPSVAGVGAGEKGLLLISVGDIAPTKRRSESAWPIERAACLERSDTGSSFLIWLIMFQPSLPRHGRVEGDVRAWECCACFVEMENRRNSFDRLAKFAADLSKNAMQWGLQTIQFFPYSNFTCISRKLVFQQIIVVLRWNGWKWSEWVCTASEWKW